MSRGIRGCLTFPMQVRDEVYGKARNLVEKEGLDVFTFSEFERRSKCFNNIIGVFLNGGTNKSSKNIMKLFYDTLNPSPFYGLISDVSDTEKIFKIGKDTLSYYSKRFTCNRYRDVFMLEALVRFKNNPWSFFNLGFSYGYDVKSQSYVYKYNVTSRWGEPKVVVVESFTGKKPLEEIANNILVKGKYLPNQDLNIPKMRRLE